MITLAPDVEGIMGCIDGLAKRGVTVSIGHRWVSRMVFSYRRVES
jgi:N-acetylglucosamine-6-phosphate deacetylase